MHHMPAPGVVGATLVTGPSAQLGAAYLQALQGFRGRLGPACLECVQPLVHLLEGLSHTLPVSLHNIRSCMEFVDPWQTINLQGASELLRGQHPARKGWACAGNLQDKIGTAINVISKGWGIHKIGPQLSNATCLEPGLGQLGSHAGLSLQLQKLLQHGVAPSDLAAHMGRQKAADLGG